MTEIMQTLDTKGQSCPMPVVRAAQAIRSLASGEILEVLATDPGAVSDFRAWALTTGNDLIEQSDEDGVYRFVLRKA
jgi:tRNA 2-thiouridine synthesizing protein A